MQTPVRPGLHPRVQADDDAKPCDAAGWSCPAAVEPFIPPV